MNVPLKEQGSPKKKRNKCNHVFFYWYKGVSKLYITVCSISFPIHRSIGGTLMYYLDRLAALDKILWISIGGKFCKELRYHSCMKAKCKKEKEKGYLKKFHVFGKVIGQNIVSYHNDHSSTNID